MVDAAERAQLNREGLATKTICLALGASSGPQLYNFLMASSNLSY